MTAHKTRNDPEMRKAPAYQTYASDDLASEAYYGLSLASRGLYDSMLRVIWVDGHVPSKCEHLARAVRSELAEVQQALVPELLKHFEPLEGDPNRLTHHELQRQRAKHANQREQQRQGGKKGAMRRWAKQKTDSGDHLERPMGTAMGSEMKCMEVNRTETERTRSLRGSRTSDSFDTDPWVEQYAQAEAKRVG